MQYTYVILGVKYDEGYLWGVGKGETEQKLFIFFGGKGREGVASSEREMAAR